MKTVEVQSRSCEQWDRGKQGEPPPPEAWRWLQYDPSHTVSEPELKRRLRQVGIGGGGIKATMKALWAHDCIRIWHELLGHFTAFSAGLTGSYQGS
jgi:hypothetical protein